MGNNNSIGKQVAEKILKNELIRNSFDTEPMPFNIKLSNDDIRLLDAVSKITKSSRSAIMSALMEQITLRLFHSIKRKDAVRLSVKVDNEISNNNITHAYKSNTWVWEVSELDQYLLFDPDKKSNVKFD